MSIYMPKSEFELVDGRPELWCTNINAFLRMVERIEDWNILFEKKSEASGTTIYDRAGKNGTRM